MAESKILSEILNWLAWQPDLGFFWRNNSGSFKSRKLRGAGYITGVPDIIGVLANGQACFIEVKVPKGKQTAGQITFQKRVVDLGATYILATSVDNVAHAFGGA